MDQRCMIYAGQIHNSHAAPQWNRLLPLLGSGQRHLSLGLVGAAKGLVLYGAPWPHVITPEIARAAVGALMPKSWRLFLVGLVVILVGCLLAHLTQTAGGVRLEDVRFTGTGGTPMSALLYVPPNATPRTPAPGILAVHGYINSRETQSAFAIEYARRGYVVLAIDQTGHGYSGSYAFGNGFGGPDGLKYLRSLDFVDANNIGMEGHSMGGGSILAAARTYPDGYRAMVLEGSGTGTVFSPPGSTTFPHNLAVVFSQYDEFSTLMWAVPHAKDVTMSARLKSVFGTESDVAREKLYGSIEAGDARILYTPATTHPGDHISNEAVGDSIKWFQTILKGGTPRPPEDQIWIRKEIGTGLAFVGFAIVMLGAFEMFLHMPHFAALAQPGVAARDRRDLRWWLLLVATAAIPVVSFYYFFGLGAKWLPPSRLFPQSITNQVMVWALLNAAVSLALGLLLSTSGKKSSTRWWLSLQLAALTVGVGYLSLLFADYFFKVDFRFWVVALKLLSLEQFRYFLVYLLPFVLYFVVAFQALHAFLPVKGSGASRHYVDGLAALALGFLLFLIAQYLPLLLADHLLVPAQSLNAIISIQFLPLMSVLALIAVFTWRRTNHYLTGALISALFVTWYIVAGTATQFRG
jgi:pimeloyl-ACP methyl ester carboxylesterase